MDKIVRDIRVKCGAVSIPCSNTVLYVSIPKQRMQVFSHGKKVSEHIISTSTRPPSCVENSAGTPPGLHRIEQKIGDGASAGTVFFARESTDKAFWEFGEEIQERNLITSRILWLKGLDEGINSGDGVDSFRRYIYIHGTNHEDRLGMPASGGCVVLGNEDMIRLYDKIPTGSIVFIDKDDSLGN